MKLLVIGFEAAVLDPASPVSQRQTAYFTGHTVDIVEMVPGAEQHVQLADGIVAHSFGGRSRWTAAFRAQWHAWRLLRKGSYDVLTVQDPFLSGLVGMIARCGTHCRLHVQDHSAAFARRPHGLKERVLYPFARWIVRRADRVRTVSERGKRGLIALGISEDRIDVVPVAADLDAFFALPPRSSSGAHVVCIARLAHEKGVDTLLQALPEVKKRVPNVHVTIVGDGPEREILERMSERLGIQEIIQFVGRQKNVAAYLADADVYVQPSRFEGWGVAVLEAAAAGKPIVMTDVGCAGEVIRDRESGLIVPPAQPALLGEAIVQVLTDHVLAERLGNNARAATKALPSTPDRVAVVRRSLETTAAMPQREQEKWVAIFLTALAVRLALFAIIFIGIGLKGFEMGDSAQYIPLAQSLLDGNGFAFEGAPFFYRTIGYPLFLALGLKLFGSMVGFILLQCLLASLIPVVMLRLGKQLRLGGKASALAAWFAVFEPHFVYFSVTVMTETVYTLVLLLACLMLFKAMETKRLAQSVYAGVWFGIGMLIKPLLQFFPFVYAVLMLPWIKKIVWRPALQHTLIIFGVIFAMCTPWMLRNQNLFGTFALSSQGSNAALFYLGTSIVSVRDQISYQDAEAQVVARFTEAYGADLNEYDRNIAAARAAKDYIVGNPLIFARLIVINTVTLWTSANYNSFLNYYHLIPRVDHSVLPPTHYIAQGRYGDLVASFWKIFTQPFYFVGVLGRIVWLSITIFFFVGLVCAYRRLVEQRFALLFLVSLCLYLTMTIWVDGLGIEARLRFPLMPIELLYAAYGWYVFRTWRKKV